MWAAALLIRTMVAEQNRRATVAAARGAAAAVSEGAKARAVRTGQTVRAELEALTNLTGSLRTSAVELLSCARRARQVEACARGRAERPSPSHPVGTAGSTAWQPPSVAARCWCAVAAAGPRPAEARQRAGDSASATTAR